MAATNRLRQGAAPLRAWANMCYRKRVHSTQWPEFGLQYLWQHPRRAS